MFDKKYDLIVQEKRCITLCYSSQQSCSQHITLEHKVGGGGCNLKSQAKLSTWPFKVVLNTA